jgi:hypothetical protein
MSKPTLDRERTLDLIREIGKVRCWLTGFHAGRTLPGQNNYTLPGEDSLRQVQILLKDLIK